MSYHLFPNPASDKVVLSCHSKENSLTYSIISLDGKICLSGIIKDKNTDINISDLTPGVYSFKLLNPDGTLLSDSKLLKQ
ncbi:MAG: T9SS type A sorting domain-containing protein [Bacteroidetes bacterium]|nr:T9SS type A sorting domain-containing protein [Bacteroidota bacterium]